MIEFIAGVMDWLERRHCAVCGQYIVDDRECQSAACVRSRCGERKGHYDFAEAERRSLVLPGRAMRAVPEGAGGPRAGSQAAVLPDLIHKRRTEMSPKK
jgi:hypothetical protein